MLNLIKDLKDGVLAIRFTGQIDETTDFSQLIGVQSSTQFRLHLKEIERINSTGVKAWLKYFGGMTAKGVKITLVECSPAIVEQLNLIVNFDCGGVVESVQVPFACSQCHKELRGTFKTSDLIKLGTNIPEAQCPKCSGKCLFDDEPEEYFFFLNRKKAA